MPKLPDFVKDNMDKRPEMATEEAASRNFLKHIGITSQVRKRIKTQLIRSGLDYPSDWDVMMHVFRCVHIFAGSQRVKAKSVVATTLRNQDDTRTTLESLVPEYDQGDVPLIMLRHAGDRSVTVAYPIWTADTALPAVSPPFAVLPSQWNAHWWILQDVSGFAKGVSIDAVDDLLEGL
jgi:hypothetical protein